MKNSAFIPLRSKSPEATAVPFHRNGFLMGFTLIELLIVVGISAILVGVSSSVYLALLKRSDVASESRRLVSVLALARNKTLASEGGQSFGVRIDSSSNEYILFSGATFNPADPENERFSIPSQVVVSSLQLQGGGIDIVFNRLEGTTSHYGSILLADIEDAFDNSTICISESGSVYTQTSCMSNPTVFTGMYDSRHLDFDLEWSIQGASTLTLIFHDSPNPDVEVNIPMVVYFNANSTEFDWGGSVDVYGDTEILRIHTHFLDNSDTMLSIHRDQRNNNKAVDVFIDSKDIVFYAADGTPAVGAYGGTMIYR